MRKLSVTQKTPLHQSSQAPAPAFFLHRPLNAEHSTPVEQAQAPSRFIYNFANVPVHSHTPIQTKLTIGQVGDKYEQEADQIAAIVVKQINTPSVAPINSVQRTEIPEEELMMKPESSIQRLVPVQSHNSTKILTKLENSIQQARGSGQPLTENVRGSMEKAFGADFSKVKVHTDATSDQLNKSIQAKAFTTGQDVFFRQGEYNPESLGGQELLAHELTHVVQQRTNSTTMQRAMQRTHNPANLILIQRRQHNNLALKDFLGENAKQDGEEHGAYVGRVTELFKSENPQHDKDDIDVLRAQAWNARFPTRPRPTSINVPLATDFNNHVLGYQAGVGWHSESECVNGKNGYSYKNKKALATSKGTYFADTVVINNTEKSGNNGRSTFFPENTSIEVIRSEAEYVANTFKQKGQICHGRGPATGIVIDCLIRNNKVESAYPYKPGW